MKLIKLTQGKETIVDDEDFEYLNQWKWSYGGKGYAVRHPPRNKQKRILLKMHRVITNCSEYMQVDHINNNPLDNRRCNLRICSRQQNTFNRISKRKFKGVSWHKRRNKWIAHIGFNGKLIHLGYFIDEIDAAKAYDKAAILYHGQFAKLNFSGEPTNE